MAIEYCLRAIEYSPRVRRRKKAFMPRFGQALHPLLRVFAGRAFVRGGGELVLEIPPVRGTKTCEWRSEISERNFRQPINFLPLQEHTKINFPVVFLCLHHVTKKRFVCTGGGKHSLAGRLSYGVT